MNTRKMLLGAVIAAASLVAAFAGTASASSNYFHATAPTPITETSPAEVKGLGSGPQEFRMSFFKFTCENAKALNKIGKEFSETFYATLKFSHCTTYFKVENGNLLGPYTVRVTPINIEYHQNHFAELGSESESEVKLLNAGAVSATVGSTKCEVYWEPQTIPTRAIKHPEEEFGSAAYSNTEVAVPTNKMKLFPSGFQKQMVVTSDLMHIRSVASGGKCEQFNKEETTSGYYKGTVQYQVVKGNLSYEEPVI